MKLLSGLIHVFVVTVLIGTAVGYFASDTAERECTIELDVLETVYEKLADKVESCLHSNKESKLRPVSHLNDSFTEQITEAFIAYCRDEPAYNQCLDSTASDVAVCLNETQQTRFRLFRNFKLVTHQVACSENATRLVQIYQHDIRHVEYEIYLPEDLCYQIAKSQVDTPDNDDVNGNMIFQYKVFQKTLVCLNENKNEDNSSVTDAVMSMMADIMDSMMCIKDGADFLCRRIVHSN